MILSSLRGGMLALNMFFQTLAYCTHLASICWMNVLDNNGVLSSCGEQKGRGYPSRERRSMCSFKNLFHLMFGGCGSETDNKQYFTMFTPQVVRLIPDSALLVLGSLSVKQGWDSRTHSKGGPWIQVCVMPCLGCGETFQVFPLSSLLLPFLPWWSRDLLSAPRTHRWTLLSGTTWTPETFPSQEAWQGHLRHGPLNPIKPSPQALNQPYEAPLQSPRTCQIWSTPRQNRRKPRPLQVSDSNTGALWVGGGSHWKPRGCQKAFRWSREWERPRPQSGIQCEAQWEVRFLRPVPPAPFPGRHRVSWGSRNEDSDNSNINIHYILCARYFM